jgi:hypothetical protein
MRKPQTQPTVAPKKSSKLKSLALLPLLGLGAAITFALSLFRKTRQIGGPVQSNNGMPPGVTCVNGVCSYNPGAARPPIIHNRKVPLTERALSRVTGRPVITNYHS